jgi:hypothetical protein
VVTHDRRVAQSTQRIVRMKDGRIVSDHRLDDPLEEDLRMLAATRLGQAVLSENHLDTDYLTDSDRKLLRRLLNRIDDGTGAET